MENNNQCSCYNPDYSDECIYPLCKNTPLSKNSGKNLELSTFIKWLENDSKYSIEDINGTKYIDYELVLSKIKQIQLFKNN